jgi:hypothetical protein
MAGHHRACGAVPTRNAVLAYAVWSIAGSGKASTSTASAGASNRVVPGRMMAGHLSFFTALPVLRSWYDLKMSTYRRVFLGAAYRMLP